MIDEDEFAKTITSIGLAAIYSAGNAVSHEKGLRAVFEAGVSAGRPRAAVFVPEVGEPIAKAGYEVVTEAADSAAPASRGSRGR